MMTTKSPHQSQNIPYGTKFDGCFLHLRLPLVMLGTRLTPIGAYQPNDCFVSSYDFFALLLKPSLLAKLGVSAVIPRATEVTRPMVTSNAIRESMDYGVTEDFIPKEAVEHSEEQWQLLRDYKLPIVVINVWVDEHNYIEGYYINVADAKAVLIDLVRKGFEGAIRLFSEAMLAECLLVTERCEGGEDADSLTIAQSEALETMQYYLKTLSSDSKYLSFGF